MKKIKKLTSIIMILIITITLTACSNTTKSTSKELSDAEKFKEEYESLNGTKREKDGQEIRTVSIPADNPIAYSTVEEINEKINNKESFIVYFGFSECPWCRSVVEELISVANDEEIETIYYVDVKDIRDVKELDEDGNVITTTEAKDSYYELLDNLSDVLEDYTLTNDDDEEIETGEKRIYAPNVVAVSKGKAVQLESGNSEEQTDPYQELTTKMKKETYNKFKCIMDCLKEEATTCQKNSC
jgi:thiol-disulfide isomerase/thioredoxin